MHISFMVLGILLILSLTMLEFGEICKELSLSGHRRATNLGFRKSSLKLNEGGKLIFWCFIIIFNYTSRSFLL